MAESNNPNNINEICKNVDQKSRRNARRRERYQERKEEDPEYRARKSAKQQKQRERQKLEDPESHAKFLLSEKQKRINQQREILDKIMDKLYEENKSTFPFPISQTKWQNLKKEELDWMFVFNPLKLTPSDLSVRSLMDHRKVELEYLKENPNHPTAPSMIFYMKTLVHHPRDQRRLTDEEKIWIKNFHLDDSPEKEEQKYVYDQTEYKKEKRKEYYAKEKLSQKTANLNRRFIKADPNKVLSVDEITNNPYVSNFPLREQHKIDLWKTDKNPEFLDLWRKQREDYEMEVENLSIEYKENFLSVM